MLAVANARVGPSAEKQAHDFHVPRRRREVQRRHLGVPMTPARVGIRRTSSARFIATAEKMWWRAPRATRKSTTAA